MSKSLALMKLDTLPRRTVVSYVIYNSPNKSNITVGLIVPKNNDKFWDVCFSKSSEPIKIAGITINPPPKGNIFTGEELWILISRIGIKENRKALSQGYAKNFDEYIQHQNAYAIDYAVGPNIQIIDPVKGYKMLNSLKLSRGPIFQT